jgi:hypothetical protein
MAILLLILAVQIFYIWTAIVGQVYLMKQCNPFFATIIAIMGVICLTTIIIHVITSIFKAVRIKRIEKQKRKDRDVWYAMMACDPPPN